MKGKEKSKQLLVRVKKWKSIGENVLNNRRLDREHDTHHHHHLFLNREGHWGTKEDFTTSFIHFSLFSTTRWDSANSRPVHSLMLSFHLFLCLPCLLPLFTVPSKTVLARPDERKTCPYHFSLHLFKRSLCGPIACWILAWTYLLVTCSLYEMRSNLR